MLNHAEFKSSTLDEVTHERSIALATFLAESFPHSLVARELSNGHGEIGGRRQHTRPWKETHDDIDKIVMFVL